MYALIKVSEIVFRLFSLLTMNLSLPFFSYLSKEVTKERGVQGDNPFLIM